MPPRAERGPAALSPLRTVALGVGFACAVAASITIFVTENAEYLRIGILVALWGFVFAALAAGRRQTEQVMAAGAEVELRKSYELELEREVAARREYELRLEAQLRREVQEEFTSQVGALHEEMVRLRGELSEQWDSELRVERMVMRTQSVRLGGDRRESIEPAARGRATIDATPLRLPEPARNGSRVPAPARETFPPPPYGAGPGTMEFPTVSGLAPPVPPAQAPAKSWPNSDDLLPPSRPNYAPPAPTAPEPESDDVLARVLAESGAAAGGRRRKHRYADEDE